MPEQMPKIYEGHDDYVFVSYAHADRGVALPIIRAMIAEGYRVWYDDGIEVGSRYPDYIARHVLGCACFVALLSESAKASEWCEQETHYALDLHKRVLPVYLQQVELEPGLRMRLGTTQAMYWYRYGAEADFLHNLFAVRMLDRCLTDEGRLCRGVKPRSAGVQTGADAAGRPKDVPVEKPGVEPEAAPTGEPNGGSKAEPKSVSKAGHTAKPNGGQKAEPKAAPRAMPYGGPQAERRVAPKAVPTTVSEPEPKAGPATGPGSGASANASGTARPQRVATKVDGRAGTGGHVAAKAQVVPRRPISVPGVMKKGKLANYSWDDLKKVSQAIAAASDTEGLKIAKAYRLVDQDGRLQGDEKTLALKDGTKASVRILGFRHDELVGGGKAGISFEFAEVTARHRMNPTDTNEGGWEESEMRRWLTDEFLKLLPDDLRANVAAAWKHTNNVGEVARKGDTSCIAATADRLWLLSMSEVYGRLATQGKHAPWSPATYDAEGSQYQLYADKGVSTTNYGPCRKRGANSWWWLRSPFAGDSVGFLVHGGGVWHAVCADIEWGVSPGFCF